MNQPTVKAPNFRRLVIVAVVLIILSTVMIFWARDVIREVVVLPLSYLFWVLGIIIRMTPQVFFWAVLMLLTFLIAWRNLSGRRKVYMPTPIALDAPADWSHGRAAYWAVKVELLRAGRSGYYAGTFHQAVTRLLLELLAYRYRQTPRQIDDSLRDGTLAVPPQVRDYILAHHNRMESVYTGFLNELWQTFLERLRSLWARVTASRPTGPAPIDPQLAFILNYMEEELEVLHDDSGH